MKEESCALLGHLAADSGDGDGAMDQVTSSSHHLTILSSPPPHQRSREGRRGSRVESRPSTPRGRQQLRLFRLLRRKGAASAPLPLPLSPVL